MCPAQREPGDTGGPEFHEAYVETYHVEPTDYAAEAFDATLIILNGLEDGAAIGPRWRLRPRPTPEPGSPRISSFDSNGDISGDPYFIYTIKDGKPQFTAFVR